MPTGRLAAVRRAIRRCVAFILDHQSREGSWADWDLPTGPSGPWTTAFVGLQVTAVREPNLRLGSSVDSAARWLQAQTEGGGWGYNDKVGCDADSIAHAILFLSRLGIQIPERSYRALLEFQRPDGGFSTYGADEGLGSWGVSHPDVSAVAAIALLTRGGHEQQVSGATSYILDQCDASGLWGSFWWNSPLYATQASLALLRAVDAPVELSNTRRTLESMRAANSFECALLLESLLSTGVDVGGFSVWSLAERLVSEQRRDGSWESASILRLTNRDCLTPWEEPMASGRLYADPHRLYTSATAMRALCRFAA